MEGSGLLRSKRANPLAVHFSHMISSDKEDHVPQSARNHSTSWTRTESDAVVHFETVSHEVENGVGDASLSPFPEINTPKNLWAFSAFVVA